MAETYTTNQECWPYKGAVSATSWPTSDKMDLFRAEANSDIINIIGTGVSDIRTTAKKIERQIVQQKVYMLRDDKKYMLGQDKLIRSQKRELDAVFLTDELGEDISFIPGNNG